MGQAQITDPEGTNGLDPFYGYDCETFHNNSASVAITEGDLLALVWDETTATIKVALADTDTHDPASKVAVAAENIAAGGAGRCITRGFARVNIGSGSVAVGERLILTATAGQADGVAADATTVEGDTHGRFLGDEIGTTNKAPVWLD